MLKTVITLNHTHTHTHTHTYNNKQQDLSKVVDKLTTVSADNNHYIKLHTHMAITDKYLTI